jgi:MFS family permease
VNAVRLGLRANASQFALLVALNAFVGSMVGLERSVLPLLGQADFGLDSRSALMSFVAAFGVAKAVTNLAAGRLADRIGRKRLLTIGWLLAIPVPILIGTAPNWGFVILANVFLGLNQGLAWSMTVVMKIDLAGPRRRGLALGLNESAGYLGVAAAAFASGALAASIAPRTVIWVGATAVAALGTALTVMFVRDTADHVVEEQRTHQGGRALRRRALRAYSQAGLVNNLNDAVVWGLAPLYLAAHGASAPEIGAVAALYPAVWGLGQLVTGWLSDSTGPKPLIVAGMLVQAGALGLLAASGGTFPAALAAAAILGAGTALVYPTLIAAVSDTVQPVERVRAVGTYRFWRDFGFVAGAVAGGFAADASGVAKAIAAVAGLTALSGIWVAATAIGGTDDRHSNLRLAGRFGAL